MENDSLLSRVRLLFPTESRSDAYAVTCTKKILEANERCDRNEIGRKLDAIIGGMCHKLTKVSSVEVSSLVEESLSIILELRKKVLTLPLLYEGGIGTYPESLPLQFLMEEDKLRELLEAAGSLSMTAV